MNVRFPSFSFRSLCLCVSVAYYAIIEAVRARALLAFDASSVSAAVLGRSFGGLRLRGFARAALPAGALVPSALEPNIAAREDVKGAIARAAAEAGIGRTPVTVMAPQGVARLLLLDVPSGVDALEFARFRFADLPYPADEAVLEVMPVAGGRVVAAAVRKLVVEDYEAAVAAAGLAQERLDLSALAALSALAGDRVPGLVVDLVLGDAAFSMAAFTDGALRALRHRKRDRRDGEPERLRAEAERTADIAGGPLGRVRVVGAGSRALVREWSAAGLAAEAGWQAEGRGVPHDAAELPWLGAVLD